MTSNLISRSVLIKEIEDNYDCNFGEILIDPRHFLDLVDEQGTIEIKTNNKEISMKINRHESNYGRGGSLVAVFPHCPVCDKWFPIGHRQNYCDKCGQKLDFKL